MRWKYWGATGLKTLSTPRSPSTRAAIFSTVVDHIDVLMRPVRPSGNRMSARIARSTPGDRNLASADTTSGSVPASVRSMCTA